MHRGNIVYPAQQRDLKPGLGVVSTGECLVASQHREPGQDQPEKTMWEDHHSQDPVKGCGALPIGRRTWAKVAPGGMGLIPSPCAHLCRNVPGSFRCVCPVGSVLLGDGRSCASLDRGRISTNRTRPWTRLRPQLLSTQNRPFLTRTQSESQGPIQQTMHSCAPGFILKNHICVDVDECVVRKPCQHQCRNTDGSFPCFCPTGFRILPNGRNCQDVDECTEQKVHCGPSQMCFNTRGSYQCLDTPCPASYERGGSPGTCYKPCSPNCAAGVPLILQYKLLTLPLGIPAQHNVIRLSAFSEAGFLQERTSFTVLEQIGEVKGQHFGIKSQDGRGIIFTT
ncbi:hemicentin-2-like [Hoplias malabaricus]|uniref:hemicentin-2-like n=1 Tax=Hoplias malabaricus TaxID=27720 RepID=UPI0034633B3C